MAKIASALERFVGLKIGFFISSYIDTIYNEFGVATPGRLERFGIAAYFLIAQLFCKQPISSIGSSEERACARGVLYRSIHHRRADPLFSSKNVRA